MKKTVYMAPAATITQINMHPLMQQASVTSVGGNSGITMGEGEAPTAADSRRSSLWFDDED